MVRWRLVVGTGDNVGEGGSPAGVEFGPYTVYERLGVGGMATVHRARERGIAGFERTVALKRLLPHLAEDENFVAAFVREARFASLLQHGNIAQLYELGRVADSYFIAMEYVEGKDLRKCLKQARRASGPPSLEFTLLILTELCDALDYAHNRHDDDGRALGLVHRDISPSNLLISSSGHVKVIDFGIAKATAARDVTRSGAIKGKLAYLAPEALTGEIDARADLFSVGVVAHELLTAKPLFADKNDFKVIHRLQHYEPPSPADTNSECPPELAAIVLKALEKNPENRWQSARAMLEALREMIRERGLHPTSRDVNDWIEYAFSLPTEPRRARTARDSSVGAETFPSGVVSVDDCGPAVVKGPIESFLAEGADTVNVKRPAAPPIVHSAEAQADIENADTDSDTTDVPSVASISGAVHIESSTPSSPPPWSPALLPTEGMSPDMAPLPSPRVDATPRPEPVETDDPKEITATLPRVRRDELDIPSPPKAEANPAHQNLVTFRPAAVAPTEEPKGPPMPRFRSPESRPPPAAMGTAPGKRRTPRATSQMPVAISAHKRPARPIAPPKKKRPRPPWVGWTIYAVVTAAIVVGAALAALYVTAPG